LNNDFGKLFKWKPHWLYKHILSELLKELNVFIIPCPSINGVQQVTSETSDQINQIKQSYNNIEVILDKYKTQFDELKNVVVEYDQRIISGNKFFNLNNNICNE
jgi:hypothetical protein